MEKFLFGFILGALSLWFTAINKLRFDIYKEKLKAYSEIQHKASQIFNITSRVDLADRHIRFLKLHLELSEIVFSHIHIISQDVYNQVTKFGCNHTFESILKNDKEFMFDNRLLIETIRDDLKIEQLDKLNDILLNTRKYTKKISKTLKRSGKKGEN